jgi:hypothetical protein
MENRSYTEWPTESQARWIAAADTFGRHLASGARDSERGRRVKPTGFEPARHGAVRWI